MKKKNYIVVFILSVVIIYIVFIADLKIIDYNNTYELGSFKKAECINMGQSYNFYTGNWINVSNSINETASYEQYTMHDEEMFAIHKFAELIEKNEIDFVMLRDDHPYNSSYTEINKNNLFNELLLNHFLYFTTNISVSTLKDIFLPDKKKNNLGIYSLSKVLPNLIVQNELADKGPVFHFSDSSSEKYIVQYFLVQDDKKLAIVNIGIEGKGKLFKKQFTDIQKNLFQLQKSCDYVLAVGSIQNYESNCLHEIADKTWTLYQNEYTVDSKTINDWILYSPNISIETKGDLSGNSQNKDLIYYQFILQNE